MEDTRAEALNQSVRVALAKGGTEDADQIVKRAEAFNEFLSVK